MASLTKVTTGRRSRRSTTTPILVVDLSKPETYEAELSQAKGFY